MPVADPARLSEERAWLSVYTSRCGGGDGRGLERFLPAERTAWYGYGRQALAAALLRAGVRPGDRVLLPGFICRDALAGLAAAGAAPAFYAVDERLCADLASVEREGAAGARAVVAVNYFGFPQPLGRLRAWCRAQGAALIEDNAHGFLSADADAPLGLRGDLGVFSLRKTLSLPNGAALVDCRDGAAATAAAGRLELPRALERRYRMKDVLKQLMRAGGLQGASAMISGVRWLKRANPNAAPAVERMGDPETAMPRAACSPLVAQLLRRCDVGAEQARRRRLYDLCRQRLGGVPGVEPLFGERPEGVAPYGFPFRFTGEEPAAFLTRWRRRGIEIIAWPDLPSAVQPHAPPHYRRVMLVSFLW